MRKAILIAACLALCASVDAAPTPAKDACSLLTPAQIQKVLGQPFDEPKETPLIPPFGEKWGSHCIYRAQKGGNYAVIVDFFVYVTASAAEARQWFDMGAAGEKKKSKPAIGDDAYITVLGEIHVLKGEILYWIAITSATEKQRTDLAAGVAAGI